MTAVTLTRTDPAHAMARYYWLDVRPDLFGAWDVVREWGHLGSPRRQMKLAAYATPEEAGTPLARQRHAKERRGYSGVRHRTGRMA